MGFFRVVEWTALARSSRKYHCIPSVLRNLMVSDRVEWNHSTGRFTSVLWAGVLYNDLHNYSYIINLLEAEFVDFSPFITFHFGDAVS